MWYALADPTSGGSRAFFLYAPSELGERVVCCNAPDEVIDGASLAEYIPIKHGFAVEAYAYTHPPGVAARKAAFVSSP